jgi:hypothetical protein
VLPRGRFCTFHSFFVGFVCVKLDCFDAYRYPTAQTFSELSGKLPNVSEKQIRLWFKHRRKQTARTGNQPLPSREQCPVSVEHHRDCVTCKHLSAGGDKTQVQAVRQITHGLDSARSAADADTSRIRNRKATRKSPSISTTDDDSGPGPTARNDEEVFMETQETLDGRQGTKRKRRAGSSHDEEANRLMHRRPNRGREQISRRQTTVEAVEISEVEPQHRNSGLEYQNSRTSVRKSDRRSDRISTGEGTGKIKFRERFDHGNADNGNHLTQPAGHSDRANDIHYRTLSYNIQNDVISRSTPSYANANEMERHRRLRTPARSRDRTSAAHGRSESLPSTGDISGTFHAGKHDDRHTRAESLSNSSLFSRQPNSMSGGTRRAWQYSILPVEPSACVMQLRPLYSPVEYGIPKRPPFGVPHSPSIDYFRSWRSMPSVPGHYAMHHESDPLAVSNRCTTSSQLMRNSFCSDPHLAEQRPLPSIPAIENPKDLSSLSRSTSVQKHESGTLCKESCHQQDQAEYCASNGVPHLPGLASIGRRVCDLPLQPAGPMNLESDKPDLGSQSLYIERKDNIAHTSGEILATKTPSKTMFYGPLQNLADASEKSLMKTSVASRPSADEIGSSNPSQKIPSEVGAGSEKRTMGLSNCIKDDDLSLWNARDQHVLEGAFVASGGSMNSDVVARLSSYLGRTVDHIESWLDEKRCHRI